MTIIVARVTGKRTTMCADSAVSEDGGDLVTVGHHKIWRPNDHILMGFCGDWEGYASLRYGLVSEKAEQKWFPPKQCVERWLYNNLVAGFTKRFPANKSYSVLVATRGGLYEVDNSGAVAKFLEPYAALGSGAGYARGALYVGASSVEAVRAAIAFTGNCKEPIFTEVIEEC